MLIKQDHIPLTGWRTRLIDRCSLTLLLVEYKDDRGTSLAFRVGPTTQLSLALSSLQAKGHTHSPALEMSLSTGFDTDDVTLWFISTLSYFSTDTKYF